VLTRGSGPNPDGLGEAPEMARARDVREWCPLGSRKRVARSPEPRVDARRVASYASPTRALARGGGLLSRHTQKSEGRTTFVLSGSSGAPRFCSSRPFLAAACTTGGGGGARQARSHRDHFRRPVRTARAVVRGGRGNLRDPDGGHGQGFKLTPRTTTTRSTACTTRRRARRTSPTW